MAGGINIRTEIKENTQEEKIILDVSSMELNEIALSYSSHHTITHLNLDYNNISNFPGDLVSCVPCLVYLTANGNNLIELPENFGSLKYLKEVYFCENALVRLPNSVQNLRNLKIMKLTGNKLSCLPDDFGEMENLAMLGIEENRLTKFPPTFALLSHLHTLEASNNKLQVLPRYLGSMCSLMHLNFADNQLEEIPESFSKLKELVCIDISRNKLRKLPKSCSSLSTLKKFYAGMNVIEQFPEWLGHLPELRELCMKENMLTGVCLPDDMGKVCKQLQFLDLSGNQLTKLPESFGELEHLQIVHFGSKLDELERKEWTNGNLLTKLPASFAQLCNLTRLRLDENQLQFLPEDFGSLANLEFLNLGQNLLYDLPESFGHLSKLQVCLLSRNNIQLLPSSFGFLQALEDLHLDNNLLAELPESFKQLQQLKVLDLFHNLLTEIPDCLPYLKNLQFLDLDQNPLKIAKKYIPKLVRNNSYAPRDPKLKGTWRGRFRDRIEEFVQIENKAETVGTHSVDEVEYENDNCVDVLHGIEDEPYSLNVLRRAAECNLWRKSTWHSHSGPARRPVFVRQRHVVVPMSSPPEDCDLQEEDYERTEENNWHDKECAEPEDTIDCENEEENWDVPAPEYKTHSGHLEQTDEDWVSHSVEDSKNSTPTYEQESRGNMESQLPSLEENWDDDPNDANSYSATDFHGLHNESNFSYNPKLIGFFFLPSDMHAKPIPHSYLTTKNINKLNSPAYAENQFSDAEDS